MWESLKNIHLPRERVTFDEALAIVSQNYSLQKKYPWTKEELHWVLEREGITGNVAHFGGFLYVWKGFAFARKHRPIKCLCIAR